MDERIQKQGLNELALQMAHDIRSPLSALNVILGSLRGQIPEKKRQVMCSALHRITEIATRILPRGHGNIRPSNAQELTGMIESVMCEQMIQFGTRIMTLSIDRDARENDRLFLIEAIEFSRVICNLLVNSIEATDGNGRISIHVQSSAAALWISIEDNGRGIPEKILRQLGNNGMTFGKREGVGLGLAHARKTTERAGGRLRIESLAGRGTKVTLALPSLSSASIPRSLESSPC